MTSAYYIPSGRVPAAAVPIAFACALAALPVSWAYAWLTLHAPAIFDLFIALVFSLGIGLLVRYAALKGKVRSVRWMGRAGLLIGLFAWYCQWAAWAALRLHDPAVADGSQDLIPLFARFSMSPWLLASVASEAAQVGTFLVGDWQVSGVLLGAVWCVELLIYLVFPYQAGRRRAALPFCEAAGKWAEKIPVPIRFTLIERPDQFRNMAEASPDRLVAALAPCRESDPLSFSRLVLYACEGAHHFISLDNVVVTQGEKGDTKTTEEPVLEFLRLPYIVPDELLRRLADAAAAGGDDAALPTPPELIPALAHLDGGRFEAALAVAAHYTGAAEGTLRTDALRLCALACSQLGRWDDAVGYWQTLLGEQATAHDALQLATSQVMAGDVPCALASVDRARDLNRETGEMPDMLILMSVVSALSATDKLAEAMPFLEDIREAYVQLGVTDPTFLFVRGMPVFGAFLERSWPIVRAGLKHDHWRGWYLAMLPHLDANGKTQLNEWLENHLDIA